MPEGRAPGDPGQAWPLQLIGLFRGLSEDEAEGLARAIRTGRQAYRAGELIVGPDEASRQVYAVCEGTVRLFHRGPDGREVTAHLVGSGGVFGVAALFGPPGATGLLAQAATRAVVCSADGQASWRAVASSPGVMLELAVQLGALLVEAERGVERAVSGTARRRLAGVLYRLAAGQEVAVAAGSELRARPEGTAPAPAAPAGAWTPRRVCWLLRRPPDDLIGEERA
jgi:CRP-like cAMP-binding protein